MKYLSLAGGFFALAAFSTQALAYTIDGVKLSTPAPYNGAGQTYMNVNDVLGREFYHGGREYIVRQGSSELYRGTDPFLVTELPNGTENIFLTVPRCSSKYGCSSTIVHIDEPQISYGFPSIDLTTTEISSGEESIKALGLYEVEYTLEAPDGGITVNGDMFPYNAFRADFSMNGEWIITAVGHAFLGDTDLTISKTFTVTGANTLIDLGIEGVKTPIDLSSSAVTLVVSQWSDWNWQPGVIGFGFTSNDGQPLTGIQVLDDNGGAYDLWDWWTSFSQPFYWEPIKLHIAAQNRQINVEWWAAGN